MCCLGEQTWIRQGKVYEKYGQKEDWKENSKVKKKWLKWKKAAACMLTVCILAGQSNTILVRAEVQGNVTESTDAQDQAKVSDTADEVVVTQKDKPYLALGANLSPEQKTTVLSLMGISESALGDYNVQQVTNEEEHQYLGSYIAANKIGSKALSSVVIMEGEKGSGLNVSTYNISYCTVGMYKNALVTAGVEDARIIVAGPFAISGTAALVGIIKAYEKMTGEEMSQDNVDAALNEIVVTGDIASATDDTQEVEGFIAYVKEQIAERNGATDDEIAEIVDDAQEKFDVSLSEEETQKVVALMDKINDLDLNPDKMKEQAQAIYDKIASLDEDGKVSNWFAAIIEKIKSFFASIFE